MLPFIKRTEISYVFIWGFPSEKSLYGPETRQNNKQRTRFCQTALHKCHESFLMRPTRVSTKAGKQKHEMPVVQHSGVIFHLVNGSGQRTVACSCFMYNKIKGSFDVITHANLVLRRPCCHPNLFFFVLPLPSSDGTTGVWFFTEM